MDPNRTKVGFPFAAKMFYCLTKGGRLHHNPGDSDLNIEEERTEEGGPQRPTGESLHCFFISVSRKALPTAHLDVVCGS